MNLQIFLKKFHKELADKCRGTAEFVEDRRAHFCVGEAVAFAVQRGLAADSDRHVDYSR